jgi:hypothetical protein
MRTLVRVIGWLMWLLGLGLSLSYAMSSEMMARIYRDSTYHSHQLRWEDGKIRKDEARAAMFDMSSKYVAMSQRGYPTIGGLMAIGTILILLGRKKPIQLPEPTSGLAPGRGSS